MSVLVNVVMPQLGETVSEGTILSWLKSVGESVTPDDILFEVESDKATMEVAPPAAGVIRQILVRAGVAVPVGTVVATIERDL